MFEQFQIWAQQIILLPSGSAIGTYSCPFSDYWLHFEMNVCLEKLLKSEKMENNDPNGVPCIVIPVSSIGIF